MSVHEDTQEARGSLHPVVSCDQRTHCIPLPRLSMRTAPVDTQRLWEFSLRQPKVSLLIRNRWNTYARGWIEILRLSSPAVILDSSVLWCKTCQRCGWSHSDWDFIRPISRRATLRWSPSSFTLWNEVLSGSLKPVLVLHQFNFLDIFYVTYRETFTRVGVHDPLRQIGGPVLQSR